MPSTSRPHAAPAATIDGPMLARAFAAGAAALAAQADVINAINVFPVPDGDTGTNMASTMRATAGAAEHAANGSAAQAARAAAEAALMGAKGNSGVILSQIIGGFAAIGDARELDARALAAALEHGCDAAYAVVSQPREGTILTAIAAAAAAARRTADGGATPAAALDAAVEAAQQAVADSPRLLPVLRDAGVVDAGAQGLAVMLDGMRAALRGDAPAAPNIDGGHIDEAWLRATQRSHDGAGAGFCTEFVVRGDALDLGAMRERLAALGESVLVVGGGAIARVHLHTPEAEAAFAYGRSLGAISQEKADDLRAQVDAVASRGASARPSAPPAIGAVAVAPGDGIEELMRSLGATAVVRGGQTMNPSAGELAEAIIATGAREVIVLPANPNVVLAARQAAASVMDVHAEVIEATSVPQVVAALVALNLESSLAENVAAMRAACTGVSSAEIVAAARDARVDGHEVRAGDIMGIIDGTLEVVEASPEAAVRAAVAAMVASRDAPLVTLYGGEGFAEAPLEALAAELRAAHCCEVEVVRGAQPHYACLIGVE